MSHQTFTHRHRVTYAECTIGNHVYYGRYLDLLEEARGEFFRSIGATFQELHDADTLFPVIEARLRYRGAARYDDVLKIEVWLSELRGVRINFGYRVLKGEGTVLLEADTLHACTSTSDKPKRLPEELVAKLQPFLAAKEVAKP
jgi:acyl-CoA thioester hydrolase